MKKRLLALFTALGLVLIASPLLAVTKHISLVGANGQPLANTTITIEFPDGTTKEEKTDDKGILVFDFPGKGTYRILGPNGELLQTVAVGAAAVSGTAIAIVGGALGAVAIAGNSGSDNSSSGSGSGGGTDVTGNWTIGFTVDPAKDPCNHAAAGNLDGNTVQVQITASGSSVTISETTANPDFPDSLSGSTSGSSMTASANSRYDGVTTPPLPTHILAVSIIGNSMSGTHTVSGLPNTCGQPNGEQVVFNVSGNRI